MSMLVLACSPANQHITTPASQFGSFTSENQARWLANVCRIFHASQGFFSADNIESEVTNLFAFKLSELPERSSADNQPPSADCVESSQKRLTTITNSAQVERVRIRQMLANTFVFALLGNDELAFETTGKSDVLQSLNNMLQIYPVFTQGTAELYAFNKQQKVFAFKRSGANNVRAYIAFNLSFDVHEMPLPLGFMASTKVTVWRSDAPTLHTFVTNRALTMPALSAIIVLVGKN